MKKYILFAFLFSSVLLATAQNKGFTISGSLTGVADSTDIILVNGSTGMPESSSKVIKGKFQFKGTTAVPDYKIIAFSQDKPYLTILVDNSNISVTGDGNNLNHAKVSGSASHREFEKLNAVLSKHPSLMGQPEESMAAYEAALDSLVDYISKNETSPAMPMALLKYYQQSGDVDLVKKYLPRLSNLVINSPIAQYLGSVSGSTNDKFPLGSKLPDFSQADPDGKPIKLSSYKGQYVLVDFWASWCGPCRVENPNLVKTFKQFNSKNFTVFGVSLDRSKEAWLKAVKDDELTWKHVSDLKFWGNEVAVQFGIQSIPQNFLLDPNGVIIAKNLRGMALDYKLSKILK